MNTCRAAYIELRRISSIHRFLSVGVTRLLRDHQCFRDYCNSLLSCYPFYIIQLLQKEVQKAVRIIIIWRPTCARQCLGFTSSFSWQCRLTLQSRICFISAYTFSYFVEICGAWISAPIRPPDLALIDDINASRFIVCHAKRMCGELELVFANRLFG